MAAWRAADLSEAKIETVGPDAIGPTIIDVRQRNEYLAGHIPGAANMELGSMPAATNKVPTGRVTVTCGHGERAMTAASILAARGRTDVSVLTGGPDDWAKATGRALE